MLRYYATKFDKTAFKWPGVSAGPWSPQRACLYPGLTGLLKWPVPWQALNPASRPDRTGSHKLGAAGRAAAWLPTGMRPGPVGANVARKLDWQAESEGRRHSLSASGRRMAEFELQSRGMGKGLSWLGICGLNGSSAV